MCVFEQSWCREGGRERSGREREGERERGERRDREREREDEDRRESDRVQNYTVGASAIFHWRPSSIYYARPVRHVRPCPSVTLFGRILSTQLRSCREGIVKSS